MQISSNLGKFSRAARWVIDFPPHKEIAKISDSTPEDKELLGHLLQVSKTIAQKYELENNYRLIINNGAGAGQSVFHIHVHLMGGRSLDWPPG